VGEIDVEGCFEGVKELLGEGLIVGAHVKSFGGNEEVWQT